MRETQLCTFRVGKLLCGVAVTDVQEVLLQTELTPVPLAHHFVRGLLNLRGDVIPAIDLRRRLALGDALPTSAHVIIRAGDEYVSVLVDHVEDVITADDSTFAEPPQTLTGIARDYIVGVHKLESRLLLVLDAQRIASPHEER